MRRDPRQLVSLLRMTRDPAVGLFLDERPVKVLYGTDLARCHRRCRPFTPRRYRQHYAQQTAAFTPLAGTDEAYRAMLDGAVALAQTAVDAGMTPI